MRESGLSSPAVFWRRRRGQSRKNTVGRIRGGGLVAQRGVDTMAGQVTSRGFRQLEHLDHLETLNVGFTRFSDSDLLFVP